MLLWILIIVAIIIGAFSYIMSQTGTPTNKEMDLVDLRMQKYKTQIEAMLKTQKKEHEQQDLNMEAELSAMVFAAANPIDLAIEELPLNAIDP